VKFRALLVVAALGGAAASEAAPRSVAESSSEGGVAAGVADGVWLFESTTTAGDCPSLALRGVTIENGRVVAVNGGAASPWGYVESDGTFVARFADPNGHVARAVGSLHGESGKGAWSSSTDLCGGAWRASRRGAAQ
jgi:hypothetical protein